MNSLISCASQTNKKDKPNQDFCALFENKNFSFKGVIVADGIGSHSFSEISSKFCVEKMKEKLEAIENSAIDYNTLFNDVKTELENFAKNELEEDQLSLTLLGTTLICAIEFEKEYHLVYLGNGSIWQISGNFNHFGANRDLPWNSINLLNPHTIEEKGKSVLFKYLSISDISTIPSVIKISKNEDAFGDIIVITSDGVYTTDEAKIGKDNNGVIWEMGEDTMIELYKSLNTFLSNNPKDATRDDLEFELNKYLSLLKEKDIMDDDTTLGIIISPKTIEYQQKRWEEKIYIENEKVRIESISDYKNSSNEKENNDYPIDENISLD